MNNMEKLPTFEQPSKEELVSEIERHLELIRMMKDEIELAKEINDKEAARLRGKINEEYKIIEEKQKILQTL